MSKIRDTSLGDGQNKDWTRIRRKRRKWKLCFPLQPALLVRNSLNKKPPGCEADTNDHKAKEGSYHSPAANPEDAEEPDFFVKITVKLYCKQRFKSLVKSRLLTTILLVLVMDSYGLKSDFDVYYKQLYFTLLQFYQ